ncbi:hypothetical protein [Rhodococcus phenolicus]|uniref:hypothetical protein n=1 Tax=Rhodococcus phenolicus TaxID=263849 RepID=UPI0008346ED7|nr:hypothetical protein [Rhodococcus phenolicus]
MWFGLAAVALLGALVLLYIDRTRREQSGRVREIWARAQGYKYTASDDSLPSNWHRAALAKQEYLGAIDVVHGVRRGDEFLLFDIEETATIVAVRRKVGSDVDIDLRLKSTPPPKDPDMNLLGSIGPRVVFTTDLEIARRVCDQRMVAFTESIPPHVQMLWSENDWTLGSIPLNSNGREWDAAIDTVARLSGILHVLPPVVEPAEMDRGMHDPGRPSAHH